MLQIERQHQMVKLIDQYGKITTDQLAELLHVSSPTVRRDIDCLSRNGIIKKVHGGAVSNIDSSLHEIPYASKITVNAVEKQRIGLAASKLIDSGDIIILDSGSTTLEVAKNLNKPNITALTDDVKIALELSENENVHAIICGGSINGSVYTIVGNSAIDFFHHFHVNKLFIGCDALDFTFGISDRSCESSAVKQAMLQAAEHVIMVVDHSKFNKRVFSFVCYLNQIDTIIVDEITEDERKTLSNAGIDVIVAP